MVINQIEGLTEEQLYGLIERVCESCKDRIKDCLVSRHSKYVTFTDPEFGFHTFNLYHKKPGCIEITCYENNIDTLNPFNFSVTLNLI